MATKTALKLWLHLARANAAVQRKVNSRLRQKYGQSMARFDVLAQLARAEDEAVAVGALSAALIAAPGNISRLLDRMAGEGLVRRSPAPDDRRKVGVSMTARGKSLFAHMAGDHEAWIADILAPLPPAQQSTLLHHLLALQSALAE